MADPKAVGGHGRFMRHVNSAGSAVDAAALTQLIAAAHAT